MPLKDADPNVMKRVSNNAIRSHVMQGCEKLSPNEVEHWCMHVT